MLASREPAGSLRQICLPGGKWTQREEAAMPDSIKIDRVPVLTLWAAVMAKWLGFDMPALTLDRAVAGLSAYAKGVSLGIDKLTPDLVRE
jgi:hypothetical protein